MLIGTLETLIYDCPNSTSNGPKTDPSEKNGLISWGWGILAKLGVRGSGPPPTPLPLPVVALRPHPLLPVVAPLASHEVRSVLDILVALYKSVRFVTVSIGEISFLLLERLEAN